MIAMLLFSGVAALLVFLAGRSDKARDPRLTVLVLSLLVIFPLSVFLPKIDIFPTRPVGDVSFTLPWTYVLMVVWALGTFIAVLRLRIAARGIANWRKSSSVAEMMQGIEIRILPGLKGPVAAGVMRPVIFVPESWNQWPDETRRVVLDHEINHHRRHDPLWRWIAQIACAIYGGNPLVGWMARRLTLQCEIACDALVVRNGVSVSEYARLLCDFAEGKPASGLVLAMSASSTLESRVQHLVRPGKNREWVGLCVWIALAVLSAAALGSFGSREGDDPPISQDEVQLRWSANPFPGE